MIKEVHPFMALLLLVHRLDMLIALDIDFISMLVFFIPGLLK